MGENTDIEAVLTLADPKLGKLIAAVVAKAGVKRIGPATSSPFEALVRAIVYQQLSGKAAGAIYKKLQGTVRGKLTPRKLKNVAVEKLRAAGLSRPKAKYVHNLAEWFNANSKVVRSLGTLTNEEVVAALTEISGIGVWTANVFLMFNLGRLDVVPTTDLGIQKGLQLAYGLKRIAAAGFVERRARLWRPYGSVASMYLWSAVTMGIKREELG